VKLFQSHSLRLRSFFQIVEEVDDFLLGIAGREILSTSVSFNFVRCPCNVFEMIVSP